MTWLLWVREVILSRDLVEKKIDFKWVFYSRFVLIWDGFDLVIVLGEGFLKVVWLVFIRVNWRDIGFLLGTCYFVFRFLVGGEKVKWDLNIWANLNFLIFFYIFFRYIKSILVMGLGVEYSIVVIGWSIFIVLVWLSLFINVFLSTFDEREGNSVKYLRGILLIV